MSLPAISPTKPDPLAISSSTSTVSLPSQSPAAVTPTLKSPLTSQSENSPTPTLLPTLSPASPAPSTNSAPALTPATTPTPQPPFALHTACRKNRWKDALELITSHPEMVNVKDEEGKLPLHHAAIRNAKYELIEALIKANRNTIFVKDGSDKTALQLANQYYADEKTLISLNDKRRKLRDEKERQEREALRLQELELQNKSAYEVEDRKRESVELIGDLVADISKNLGDFCESQNETGIPWDERLLTKIETDISKLKAASKLAPQRVEVSRLEDFFGGKSNLLKQLNDSVQAWAKKVKVKVRGNKTLESTTDSYSKVLVLVSLDDPISNRLTENDDNVDKVNFYEFDGLTKELAWRVGKIKLAWRLQVYFAQLLALKGEWMKREAEESFGVFDINDFIEKVSEAVREGEFIGAKNLLPKVAALKTDLSNVLKELRMRGVGGGENPNPKGGGRRRHSFTGATTPKAAANKKHF
ncbi:hypothetical protein TrST_g10354 [Triparma strigata]|uniref:Uncharacterized protein n=1 Tax=Triparma strigata TaxID=1606541 RepID=A0A9W7EI88_9STRA|nr:hypothetical protein TrST_g10354 [Triparma strigata]